MRKDSDYAIRGHYACYLVALVEGNMMLLRFDSSKDGDQSEQGKAMLQPVCSAVACTGRLLLRALLPEDAEALHRPLSSPMRRSCTSETAFKTG